MSKDKSKAGGKTGKLSPYEEDYTLEEFEDDGGLFGKKNLDDFFFLTFKAFKFARRGRGHTRPNPCVGAVVVRKNKIVGVGWHKRAGGEHAEVMALRDAGRHAKDSTLYVTLEPCSTPGRVGACTDAIIAAGVSRVVYASDDPNPRNAGRAKDVLAKAGIACEKCQGIDESDRNELSLLGDEILRGFKKVFARPEGSPAVPYITVKIAMSLDGKICDKNGNSKWISSDKKRAETDEYRSIVDAVMVGAETVRRDNPSLLYHGGENPDLLRVIVTSSGKGLSRSSQVFSDDACARTYILCVGRKTVPDALKSWTEGERPIGGVIAAPTMALALDELHKRTGVLEIFCEGGMKLATSLAEEGLVDEWLSITAPIVIGSRTIDNPIRINKVLCSQD